MLKEEIIGLKIHAIVNDLITPSDEEDNLKITCTLGLLTGLVIVDRKVGKLELSYLKRYSRYFLKLNKALCDELVKLFLVSFKEDSRLTRFYPSFKDYLKDNLSKEEKDEFIKTMVAISRGDLEIHDSERSMIEKTALDLGISQRIVSENFLEASLIIMQKMKAQIESDPTLVSTDNEIKTIEICTSADYYKEMQKTLFNY